MDAIVGSLDGKIIVRGKMHGKVGNAEDIGTKLAESLLASGAEHILQAIRSTIPTEQTEA